MKILLVEDNNRLSNDIRQFLEEDGFIVAQAENLALSREKLDLYQYDAVIIDIGLPDGSGLDLIPVIRELENDTGILIVTARNAVEDKVAGLNLGADDYLTKPFHKAELIARTRSILRRHKSSRNNILQFKSLQIDTAASQVFIGEKTLKLTRKEYDLLLYFMYNPNRLLTKENIAEHLWGDHIDQADNFDFVYNHIKNLRKKIVHAGGENYIHAMYGMGYKFSENN